MTKLYVTQLKYKPHIVLVKVSGDESGKYVHHDTYLPISSFCVSKATIVTVIVVAGDSSDDNHASEEPHCFVASVRSSRR